MPRALLIVILALTGCTIQTVDNAQSERPQQQKTTSDGAQVDRGDFVRPKVRREAPKRRLLGGQEGEPVMGGQEGEPDNGLQTDSSPAAPPSGADPDTEGDSDDGFESGDTGDTDTDDTGSNDTDTGDTGVPAP